MSSLTLLGDRTTTPDNHVIYFSGEHPCHRDGTRISAIQHGSADQMLAEGVIVNHSFSNKPEQGYANYYEKFRRYCEIIMAPAHSLDPTVTITTFKVVESSSDSVFQYYDTNTSRANTAAATTKLQNQKIAIIGCGGTGSYILDLIAKTPVSEIHLYDGDDFLQHNAFRSPGAPSIEQLNEGKLKVDYLREIYQKMHKHIIAHGYRLHEDNVRDLVSADFYFISMDEGSTKRSIINHLELNNKPYIDAGIGVQSLDDSLIGQVRITMGTPEKNDHIYDRVSFADGVKDEYFSNIQIADLNALNGALSVIKWKKYFGFYQDLYQEHNITFDINTGELHNDDYAAEV